jgi:Mannosyltransferase (PIG-V)
MTNGYTSKRTWTGIWLALRVYTFLCGALAAYLANTSVLAVWKRWDTVYYSRIASAGYSVADGTTTFHPLFPWLAKPLSLLGVAPVISLLLVSSCATLAVYLAFERLALLDHDAVKARTATFLFVFWPVCYVLYLPYSESLWLLFAVLCLLYARRGRWWTASLAGALATITRQQGLFLIVPLAWEFWAAADYDFRQALKRWQLWLSFSLIPLAYVAWVAYRILALGDLKPDFSSVSRFISSTLVSPASHLVVKDHAFTWPWKAAYLAIQRALTLSYVNPWMDLGLGLLFLLLIALAWREMRASYRIYVALIAVVSFSFHTGMTPTGGAYLSLPRHLLLAFPVFIGLASRVSPRQLWVVITLGIAMMTFLLFGYFWVRLVP